ncbi:MAG TPA: stage V sporulation protein AD [Candidatus Blautia stercoripullorum]|uniref:Stage V sporulation protein AD n=1 Tax=Candidatus Blautia stercoripullorum TaxID=2838502 RepID=A0A9D2R6U3_9FIRM|nr:stage V sporulation protein AD [Candidatus Blautia stercoripullorum]
MGKFIGSQSIQFDKSVYILGAGSIVGKKEGDGPLGKYFDKIGQEDGLFGCRSWEEAESTLQKEALSIAVSKTGIAQDDLRLIYAGDLLAQTIASSFGIMGFHRPVYGLYGACATMGEALSLASMAVAGEFGEYVGAVTSSHFGSAEKEFRFPLGYGNQRPLSATWTVTGSGACILGTRRSHVRITGITTGKIVDFGLKDSLNMGACMAPAACSTIEANLKDFGRVPEDYDKIITGDLGEVGQRILFDLMEKQGISIEGRHMDCGIEIFDKETQDTHAGGSGCGCSAVTFASYILPKIAKGEWKRILFVPTGALLSKVSYNEGKSVPGIAQAVVVEHC